MHNYGLKFNSEDVKLELLLVIVVVVVVVVAVVIVVVSSRVIVRGTNLVDREIRYLTCVFPACLCFCSQQQQQQQPVCSETCDLSI